MTLLDTARAAMESARMTAESDHAVTLATAASRYERALTNAAAARLTTERAARDSLAATLRAQTADYEAKRARYHGLATGPTDHLSVIYLRASWNIAHPSNTHALHDAEWLMAACAEIAAARGVSLPSVPEYAR